MYIPMRRCIVAAEGRPFAGVLHIGAHLGEEARDYADSGVKNVLWVEANPGLMAPLYEMTRNVPIHSKYLNAVLSDVDDEEITLNIANNSQSSSILELGTHADMYPQIGYVERLPVRTKRLDTLARAQPADIDLRLYDFVNLDVQGAELKVLRGFGDSFQKFPVRAVYCEVNREEVYKGCCLIGEVDAFLRGFGFQRIMTAMPERTWGDALYLR